MMQQGSSKEADTVALNAADATYLTLLYLETDI